MPTYDFKCNQCGHRFSLVTSISGRKNAVCPECASREVTQLLTGFFYARPGGDGAAASSGGSCSGGSCSSCSGC
ncbi:MAG: zinc ribbon domain-containing protein [Clostridia bacterium]|nr:MAG: zinc ribbon domain-containing protein [Clostridia bacterium]